jgi:hypothetical protein
LELNIQQQQQGECVMKKVMIILEFEDRDEVDEVDVKQYLQELIEQDCLSYEEIV